MTSDSYCFCELAPLYVLGTLSEEERHWVEAQLIANPELEAELEQYRSALSALPYSIPSPLMADDLKDRLFQRLGHPTPPTKPAQISPSQPQQRLIRFQDLTWRSHPVPGVQVAILHTDRSKREITGLLRAEAGVHYPLHRHAAVEEILMLEGSLVISGQVYGKGDYIRSESGSMHGPDTPDGCIFFFRTSLDDEFLETP